MGYHTINTAMEKKSVDSVTNSSRRHVLKTLGGMIAAGLSTGRVSGQHQDTFSTNNTTQNISKERRPYYNNTLEHNMKGPPAYITDPGFSLTSLLANLPYILNSPNSHSPIILMDTYDYDRLRGRVLREPDNEKIQYLGMAYEELRQRDIIRLIDYAKLYPPAVQQRTLRQNQKLLNKVPERTHQKAAVQGAAGLVKYWGKHQRSFRSSIGADWEVFASQRKGVIQQRKKMERGGGDPIEWNRNVLNEYVTALKVRQRADRVLNLDVKGVVGQGDSGLLCQVLDSANPQHTGEISDVKRLKPNQYMFRFSHEAAIQSREILDKVSEIAADVAGVQHEDWSFLGSTLALPKFKNFDHIQSQIRGTDVESLIEETQDALAVIEKRANERSLDQARYQADWMGEQYDLPQIKRQDLTKEFSYAFDLIDRSQDLRDLGEGNNISRPAFFLAASVVSDPSHRYETDELYRHARNLLNQLGPASVTETELETYRQRGDYLQGESSDTDPDWFEKPDRTR